MRCSQTRAESVILATEKIRLIGFTVLSAIRLKSSYRPAILLPTFLRRRTKFNKESRRRQPFGPIIVTKERVEVICSAHRCARLFIFVNGTITLTISPWVRIFLSFVISLRSHFARRNDCLSDVNQTFDRREDVGPGGSVLRMRRAPAVQVLSLQPWPAGSLSRFAA